MKNIKPPIDERAAAEFLQETYGNSASNISIVDTGLIAQTFRFQMNGRAHYLQFNHTNMSHGLRIEHYLAPELASNGVPIRDVLADGMWSDLHYTIALEVKGATADQMSEDEKVDLLDPIIEMLYRIAHVDLGQTSGYGWLDSDNNGQCDSWPEHLLGVKDEEPGYFYGNWHEMFETTFLSRSKFDIIYRKLEAFVRAMPEIRCLVHGGIAFKNFIAKGAEITAVLDWVDARYGDPLLDVAYFDFWNPGCEFIERYIEYGKKQGLAHHNYTDRIKCYQHYFVLDSMRFFAKTDNLEAYNYVTSKLS